MPWMQRKKSLIAGEIHEINVIASYKLYVMLML